MAGMHVGIAATMPPVFFHQAICYLVMVDWAPLLPAQVTAAARHYM